MHYQGQTADMMFDPIRHHRANGMGDLPLLPRSGLPTHQKSHELFGELDVLVRWLHLERIESGRPASLQRAIGAAKRALREAQS